MTKMLEFHKKFDVFSSKYENINKRFLEVIKDGFLPSNILLLFPAFYDFEYNNEKTDIIIHQADADSYYILYIEEIEPSIIEHISYRKGITSSYCHSDSKTSYIDMFLQGEDTISYEIKNDIYNNTNSDINTSYQHSRCKLECYDFFQKIIEQKLPDNIKVVHQNNTTQAKDNLNVTEFENGIKAHFPLLCPYHEHRHIYYFFPNNIEVGKSDKHRGNGGIFIVARGSLDLCFLYFMSTVAFLLSDKIAQQLLNNKIQHGAISSAIGSIMSRNGSHNIGSHVLSALTYNVGTMPDDRILYQYIQHRMDYVATVTTDFPSWVASTMFVGDLMKNFFTQHHLLEYIASSEGLSAYRFQDHNLGNEGRKEQKGKIKIFIRKVHPCINNIEEAKKELNENPNNTEAQDSLEKLRNEQFDLLYHRPSPMINEPWSLAKNAKDNALHFINYIDYDEDKTIPLEHDVSLAIPGGAIGRHAFYTIIENIIRNAAKHGWSSRQNHPESQKSDNLEIYIDFFDSPAEDDIFFIIWDNMSDVFSSLRDEKWNWDVHKIALLLYSYSQCMLEHESESAEVNNCPDKRAEFIKNKFSKYPEILVLMDQRNELQCPPNKQQNQELQKKLAALHDNITTLCKNAKIEESKVEEKLCSLINNPHDGDMVTLFMAPLTATEINMLQDIDVAIPLHGRQQILLSSPFIDENGNLRKENWGLAEMKISAGYLQRRKISEIGGMEEAFNDPDKAIILPVAMPGVCRNKPDNGKFRNAGIMCTSAGESCSDDCPRKRKHYHLGYRFRIPKPKEMLVVLDQSPDVPEKDMLDKFKNEGVYFALKQGEDLIKCSVDTQESRKKIHHLNYDYVVLPSAPKKRNETNTDPLANYPSRLLINSSEGNNARCARIELKTMKFLSVKNLKITVYNAWLDFLKERSKERSKDVLKDKNIELQLQTEGRSTGSSQELVTNQDIFKLIFSECYHSTLIAFLREHRNIGEDSKNIITLLSLYPFEQSDLSKDVKDEVKKTIHGQLVTFCKRIENDLSLSDIRTVVKSPEDDLNVILQSVSHIPNPMGRKIIEKLCRRGLGSDGFEKKLCRSLLQFLLNTKMDKVLFDYKLKVFCSDDSVSFIQPASRQDVKETIFSRLRKLRHPRESSFARNIDILLSCDVQSKDLDALSSILFASFQTSDIFLRRYDEQVITLPHGYKAAKENDKSPPDTTYNMNHSASLNVRISSDSGIIKYRRHDNSLPPGTIYAEALSGSQSYLNTLSRLRENAPNSFAQITRLAENGLLRILIIDERVCNFLSPRPEMIKAYSAMAIWAVNVNTDSSNGIEMENVNVTTSSLLKKPIINDFNDKGDISLGFPSKVFDILIIHQGIIDKWWSKAVHNAENVGKIIAALQKTIPYVVITTGRGRPDNIPGSAKVLPFSSIESCLFRRYPEKLTLLNTVMNILPSEEKL